MALKFKSGASFKPPPTMSERRNSFSFASVCLFEWPSSHISIFFMQTFFSSFKIFLQQRHVCFPDRWQEACDGISEKRKASPPLGQMSAAFEQNCWSNLPWGFGHWLTPDESEQERKEREGKYRGNKSVPLFPKAMKRDFDLKKINKKIKIWFHLLSSF